jgi:hypothetical protein
MHLGIPVSIRADVAPSRRHDNFTPQSFYSSGLDHLILDHTGDGIALPRHHCVEFISYAATPTIDCLIALGHPSSE